VTSHSQVIEIPGTQDLLTDFSRRRHLELTDVVEREYVAIRATVAANLCVNAGYAGLDEAGLADPAVGMLLNMLHRNFEIVEGAIVGFVTECGQAAQVAARAGVELSISIAYIAAGTPKDRLRAYFEHYFQANERQLKTWSTETADLAEQARHMHDRGIEKRRTTDPRAPRPRRWNDGTAA
jgi:hypothetical protein